MDGFHGCIDPARQKIVPRKDRSLQEKQKVHLETLNLPTKPILHPTPRIRPPQRRNKDNNKKTDSKTQLRLLRPHQPRKNDRGCKCGTARVLQQSKRNNQSNQSNQSKLQQNRTQYQKIPRQQQLVTWIWHQKIRPKNLAMQMGALGLQSELRSLMDGRSGLKTLQRMQLRIILKKLKPLKPHWTRMHHPAQLHLSPTQKQM